MLITIFFSYKIFLYDCCFLYSPYLQSSLVNSSNEFMRSLDGIIILSRVLPQLPPSNPRTLNLCKWIKSLTELFCCMGRQRKSLQAEQKPSWAPCLWVPRAETYMSIWYQHKGSRKCQICSACIMQTACTCSVNLPRQDASGSQHTPHKLDAACAELCSTFSASTQWSAAQHMCMKSTHYFQKALE